jgi:hypothetical protein
MALRVHLRSDDTLEYLYLRPRQVILPELPSSMVPTEISLLFFVAPRCLLNSLFRCRCCSLASRSEEVRVVILCCLLASRS